MYDADLRGYNRWIVLFPGWGFDREIFDTMDLPFNYLYPKSLSHRKMVDAFPDTVRETGDSRISLFGWSLGAHTALTLARQYPTAVEKVYLLGVREHYDPYQILNIDKELCENKEKFMRRFYRYCFEGGSKSIYAWFQKNLYRKYLERISLETLRDGLEMLARERITLDGIDHDKIIFIHGSEDLVAPVEEAMKFKDEVDDDQFIVIDQSGHVPFLSKQFAERFAHV